MSDHPDWWDPYSCQPYKLTDSEKPRANIDNFAEYAKVLATFLGLSPALIWKYITLKPGKVRPMQDFAGLSISIEQQWQSAQLEMVKDLGVKNLLIRIADWQLNDLDNILQYLKSFNGADFTVNILQSRNSVGNHQLWREQVYKTISALQPVCKRFKIANAVNRSKWGCSNSGNAIELFKIADKVKQEFSNIELLGSSVIDFEPLISLRTLFNFSGVNYDGCASLLYINRRGSAYGKQYSYFDLNRKLRLNKAILELSNNTKNNLWITETNWPLLDTKPYTPNSGNPRSTVDEQTQAEYLLQYFNIAQQCGWVERVYWWQLINPGYGLVDHRGPDLRKMPSYFAFKSLFEEEQ